MKSFADWTNKLKTISVSGILSYEHQTFMEHLVAIIPKTISLCTDVSGKSRNPFVLLTAMDK